MTADGQRLFGDEGLLVDSFAASSIPHRISGNFDGSTLGLVSAHGPAIPGAASVTLHRIGGDGTILGGPIAISGPASSAWLRSLPMGDGQVVSWFGETAPFSREPVLQLVQFDGTIGLPQPSADLNGDGVVDGADLGILLSAWGRCVGCTADLNGDGVVDGADLGVLLSAWTS